MNVFPFGQEAQSRIQTSAAILSLKIGNVESSAVSRIAIVGAGAACETVDDSGRISVSDNSAVSSFLFI